MTEVSFMSVSSTSSQTTVIKSSPSPRHHAVTNTLSHLNNRTNLWVNVVSILGLQLRKLRHREIKELPSGITR